MLRKIDSKKDQRINGSIVSKTGLTTAAIFMLASSSIGFAAKSDLIDAQQGGIAGAAQTTAPIGQATGSTSILDSLKQPATTNAKKDEYIQVLNLLKDNKIAEAKKKLAEMQKSEPQQAEYYNLQALAETLEKNTEAAQKSYLKAISLNKSNILAYLGLSKLMLEAGNLDKAKEYANQALSINDKSVNAYLLLADVELKNKNLEGVEKILLTGQEKAKGNLGTELEVIKALGQFYGMQKQPEKILSMSEDVAKRYADNTLALSILAQAQILNNKNDLAEKTLQKVSGLDKKDIGSRLLLVRLLNNQPDKEKDILALLDETVAIDVNNPEPQMVKAAYLIKLKRTPEALEIANKIDAKFPQQPLGKLLKGDVYLADKNLDKALEVYQQAYKIKPNDKVLLTIADILNAKGKADEAIKLLNKELVSHSKDGAIHFKLATLYQGLKDYAQAEKHYQAILDLQADNVLALNNLAWIYLQQNNPKALELAKKAYEKSAKSPAVADTYGVILVKQGQVKEGTAILEEAVAQAPKVSDIQFHLAEAYASADDKKKAQDILETILKGENFSEKANATALLDKLKAK
jgi:putative PEP-CTERM system TPR-repeat lipoprotein